MLMITAEIWPGGDKSRKHVIGEMRIANESDLADISSYSVKTSQAADPGSGAASWQSSLVIHGHRRSDGMWALVRAILDEALPNAAHVEPSIGEANPMYNLAAPLILALIALQTLVMLDPISRPAPPVAGAASVMSIVAIAILPAPIKVSAPIGVDDGRGQSPVAGASASGLAPAISRPRDRA